MTKKLTLPDSTEGYGYVGTWHDGILGWCLPDALSEFDTRREPAKNDEKGWQIPGDRSFLCRITITPVTDKRGRPVTRIAK